VQDLFKYDPNKAKQLLAEAGYPNGFKTTVASSNDPQLLDELSVYQSMWAKVGIDLTIDPRDASAFTAFMLTRQYEQLLYRPLATSMSVALAFMPYRGPSTSNPSYIDDPLGSAPEIDSIYKEVSDNVFVDWPKTYAAFKELKPVLLENAYVIPRPTPYIYTLWWPWVKNYYGMQTTAFVRYAWVDQDLKKSMGH
jgi:peptide/nickel transport system substrate-binding protein